MPSIKCGNCGGTHVSVLQVRECYAAKRDPFDFSGGAKSPRQLRDERAVLDTTSTGKPITVPEQHNANGFLREEPVGASPRQAQYVYDLLTTRDIGVASGAPQDVVDPFVEETLKLIAEGKLTYKMAIGLIRDFKDAPTVPESQYRKDVAKAKAARIASGKPNTIVEDGIYLNRETGQLWKVQYNHGTGDGKRLYAKKGVAVDGVLFWEYEGKKPLYDGAITPDMRMTLAEAKEFGKLYGQCMRCGRKLTDETSIEEAMGRICRSKKNWA